MNVHFLGHLRPLEKGLYLCITENEDNVPQYEMLYWDTGWTRLSTGFKTYHPITFCGPFKDPEQILKEYK